tara:strand:- start:1927 stop:2220 length:294 start_codon:yes stop_codon:yes gene_type:complete
VKKPNFTKKDLCKNIKDKTGLSYNYSDKIINNLISILTKKITKGNLILKNIGTFKILKKRSRIGRNPKTKKKYIITERNSLSFIASKNALKILNRNL